MLLQLKLEREMDKLRHEIEIKEIKMQFQSKTIEGQKEELDQLRY